VKMKLISAVAGLALMACSPALHAQERYPQGPVVHPDHTVTFSLKAPAAQDVKLEGAWPGGTARTTVPMIKGADGTWTVTSGPISPDLWTYSFRVDGVRMADPGNMHTFQEGNISALLIPGPKSYDYELHDVPHGTVSAIWYPAPSLKLPAKRTQVYTPPGYETGTQRYPVLYLAANDHADYIQLTRVNNILDNLIAAGKAKPMIVVLVGTIPNAAAAPWLIDTPLPSTVGRPSRFSAELNPHGGMLTLPPYLDGGSSIAKDLVPFIDKTYRTISDREHRAVVGISAPGAAAFYAGMTNVKTFAWVAGFSTGWPSLPGVWEDVPLPHDADKRFPLGGPDIRQNVNIEKLAALLPDMNAKANLRPVYLYQGENDALIESHVRVKKLLDERGVKHVDIETPGYGHDWRYWAFTIDDYLKHVFVN